MSGNWQDPDVDDVDDTAGEGIKDLRAAFKKQQKRITELEARNTELETGARRTGLSSILTAKGYNVKVAKLIPPDVAATDEAVASWLDEYSDALNLTPSAPPEGDGGSVADAAEEQNLRTISGQMINSAPLASVREQDMQALLDPNLTKEQWEALIQSRGGGVGVG